jgi:hypothetical protein
VIVSSWLAIVVLVVTCSALQTSGSPQKPFEILDDELIAEHRLIAIPPVRVVPGTVEFPSSVVALELTVDERGHVISAAPVAPENAGLVPLEMQFRTSAYIEKQLIRPKTGNTFRF